MSSFLHIAARIAGAAVLGLVLAGQPVAAQVWPTAGQPRTGGAIRIGIWSEPAILNPDFSTSGATPAIGELTLEGMTRGAPDGSYTPVLASEVPTQANGDVSADGLVVTWKLKPAVTWSDGQPFTSQDVVFTYHVLSDPTNAIAAQYRADVTPMESVTAPDENTVVVTYKQVYAPYREAFPWILPAHVFNGQTSIGQDAFNRAPTVGTGPFVFKSWSAGDTIEFDRNPNYREPGRPYLDQVYFKITPSKASAVQALQAGDLDVVWFLDETFIPQLQTMSGVSIDAVPWGNVEKLYLNTTCSTGPQQGDPACPNPVLGDVHVRQAIALTIDKQTMAHSLAFGLVTPASSVLPVGPFAVELPGSMFDPDRARQLLDQAGWAIGSDGIREQSGVRAHLGLTSVAGDDFRAQEEQIIQQDLKTIGLEVEIRNVPAASIGNGFPGKSPLSLGSYDLALFTDTYTMDPLTHLLAYIGGSALPNPQTQTGNNWTREVNPLLDQSLASAGDTLDSEARLAAYTSVSQVINTDAAEVPLYARLDINPHSGAIQGWQTNANDFAFWNAAEWWLSE